MREKLLADAKAPQDVYKGADKAKIKNMISSAWKKAYPEDQILAIRFHNADWKRTKTKKWNDAVKEWQYNDVSSLGVSVIVKADEKVATIYAAFVNKDHISGTMNTGVATKTSGYVVKEMLIANLK